MEKLHAIYWGRCRNLFLVERIFHRQLKVDGFANCLNHPLADTRGKPSQASASKEERNFLNQKNNFCLGQSNGSGENLLKVA